MGNFLYQEKYGIFDRRICYESEKLYDDRYEEFEHKKQSGWLVPYCVEKGLKRIRDNSASGTGQKTKTIFLLASYIHPLFYGDTKNKIVILQVSNRRVVAGDHA